MVLRYARLAGQRLKRVTSNVGGIIGKNLEQSGKQKSLAAPNGAEAEWEIFNKILF